MYGHGYHDEESERNPHRNYMNPSSSMAGPAPGLFLWAWASGDTLVLDSARELSDNLYWRTTRTNYGEVSAVAREIARETGLQKCDDEAIPCEGWGIADGSRTGAHVIKAMRQAWLATGDAGYLNLVTSLSEYLRRLEQTTGPSCDRFTFQSTFVSGLGQHLLWLREVGLPVDGPSRQLLSQRIDYMINTLWNPATSQFRMCYDGPTLFPVQDNWLFTVADAFAAGALVLDRPELIDTYARPLFEYGAANQFYPGSFLAYHSTKEYVNQVGFGHLFLNGWWRRHGVPAPGELPPFTDDPLTVRTTSVKTMHVTELREAIGALRTRFNVGSFVWTDATIVAGITPVRAVHLNELRSALNQVYVAAGRSTPSYTHVTVTAGTDGITVVDIAELRAAVLAIW